ncbi:hypothetical protein LOTGIDRAFT_68351, partial [Lottia gigantea]
EEVQEEAPNFVILLKDMTVNESSVLKLEVEVTGIPAPEITWHFEDEEIIAEDDIELITEQYKSTLIINKVLPEDEGEYRVEAVNKVGSCSCVAYITV